MDINESQYHAHIHMRSKCMTNVSILMKYSDNIKSGMDQFIKCEPVLINNIVRKRSQTVPSAIPS